MRGSEASEKGEQVVPLKARGRLEKQQADTSLNDDLAFLFPKASDFFFSDVASSSSSVVVVIIIIIVVVVLHIRFRFVLDVTISIVVCIVIITFGALMTVGVKR